MAHKKIIPNKLKDSIIDSLSLAYSHIRVNILNKPIKIWFYREADFLNFGDEITPDIIKLIFHKKCVRVKEDDAELFAVG